MLQEKEPESIRKACAESRERYYYPGRERYDLKTVDELLHWHAWQVPAYGEIVTQRIDHQQPGRPRIVSGVVCDRLVRRNIHAQACPSCECFELVWSLGFWVTDSYWLNQHTIGGPTASKIRGTNMDEDDFCTDSEAPHWLRPAPEFNIPTDIVRPRIREAFLKRREARIRQKETA